MTGRIAHLRALIWLVGQVALTPYRVLISWLSYFKKRKQRLTLYKQGVKEGWIPYPAYQAAVKRMPIRPWKARLT